MNILEKDVIANSATTHARDAIALDDSVKPEDAAITYIRGVNDFMLKESGAFDQTACQAGCSFCCTLRPEVYPGEAVRIVTLLKTLPTGDYNNIVNNLRGNAIKEGLHPDNYIRAKVKCAFLNKKTNCCQVYNERPILCRDYSSTNMRKCRKAVGNPSCGVPQSTEAFYTSIQITSSLRNTLIEFGVDPSSKTLHKAVLALL